MGSLDALARELRKFDGRKEIIKQLRTEVRKPVPNVRKAIKGRALAIFPSGGGLNVWVSKIRITAKIKISSRRIVIALRGGRNSAGGRSDMKALDRGRVRAPSWGHRTRASWHTQSVEPGFFSQPTTETREWQRACVRAAEKALRTIRG